MIFQWFLDDSLITLWWLIDDSGMTIRFIQGETIQGVTIYQWGKLFKGGHYRLEKGFDRGHYSRGYIIQGRTLIKEIRYFNLINVHKSEKVGIRRSRKDNVFWTKSEFSILKADCRRLVYRYLESGWCEATQQKFLASYGMSCSEHKFFFQALMIHWLLDAPLNEVKIFLKHLTSIWHQVFSLGPHLHLWRL